MKHLKRNATNHSHSYVLTVKMYLCTYMFEGIISYTNVTWPQHLLDTYKYLF